MPEAARVVAARPSARWAAGTERISGRLRTSMTVVRRDLHSAVSEWNRDPRKAAHQPLQNTAEVRARLTAVANRPPQERWAPLADELDPRLVQEGDWPALASLMQDAHAQGHDVAAVGRALVGQSPLGELPAHDLRYRLVARFDVDTDQPQPQPRPAWSSVGASRERKEPTALPSRHTGRRR